MAAALACADRFGPCRLADAARARRCAERGAARRVHDAVEALTGKTGLNRAVGERLLRALQKGSFELGDRLPKLAGALAANALAPDQEALALRILEAWYLGIVENVVVTYEEALMFGVVSDTLVIRSYCPNKPGFWADKPIERQA